MKNSIQQLQINIDNLLSQHYRRETQKWYTDAIVKEIEADEHQTKAYRDAVRVLRHQIRMMREDALIMRAVDAQDSSGTQTDEFKKLMPLVSRRRHQELWGNIRKEKQDGEQFTFVPGPIILDTIKVCGCTNLQLLEQIQASSLEALTGYTAEGLLRAKLDAFQALARQHTLMLDGVHKTGGECLNPIDLDIKAHQYKHTIGNWDCKACLNAATAITGATQANAAMDENIKALEWCPRFMSVLRHLTFADYLKTVAGQNVCYAGLVHSEMSFAEEAVEAREIRSGELCGDSITKNYVVITKKCDSCNFTDVIKKEYIVPAVVEEGDVLQVFEEAKPQAIVVDEDELSHPGLKDFDERDHL